MGVKGDVKIAKKYLGMGGQGKGGFEAKGVSGVKVDVAFIENNMIPCKELKGYEFREGMAWDMMKWMGMARLEI